LTAGPTYVAVVKMEGFDHDVWHIEFMVMIERDMERVIIEFLWNSSQGSKYRVHIFGAFVCQEQISSDTSWNMGSHHMSMSDVLYV